jgi:hypothetical protein
MGRLVGELNVVPRVLWYTLLTSQKTSSCWLTRVSLSVNPSELNCNYMFRPLQHSESRNFTHKLCFPPRISRHTALNVFKLHSTLVLCNGDVLFNVSRICLLHFLDSENSAASFCYLSL